MGPCGHSNPNSSIDANSSSHLVAQLPLQQLRQGCSPVMLIGKPCWQLLTGSWQLNRQACKRCRDHSAVGAMLPGNNYCSRQPCQQNCEMGGPSRDKTILKRGKAETLTNPETLKPTKAKVPPPCCSTSCLHKKIDPCQQDTGAGSKPSDKHNLNPWPVFHHCDAALRRIAATANTQHQATEAMTTAVWCHQI